MSFTGTGANGKDVRQHTAAGAPLVRQSSIYSLTFDEFQSSVGGVGKDFGSMNMDELLKSIWTAEESQVMAAALGAPDGGAGPGLQRQGSLTLPRTLSQKTVDEVWRDFVRESAGGAGVSEFQQHQQQRQPTLGEMTLEEFLVRAGVVRDEINASVSTSVVGSNGVPTGDNANFSSSVYYGDLSTSGSNNTGLVLGFAQGQPNVGIMSTSISGNSGANLALSSAGTRAFVPQMPLGTNVELGTPRGMRGGGLIGVGDPAAISNGLIAGVVGLGGGINVGASMSPVNHIPSDGLAKGNGELSSLSPVPYAFSGGLKGRKCSGAVEKVVERRQRRMIKNRESAARSRARKQAYTMELEAEVAKLKEKNNELQKKQVALLG